MNKFFTLIILACFTGGISAQTIDMVSIGADYVDQTFYNVETGEKTTIAADSWDLAFSSEGLQDGGIFLNESATGSEEGMKLYYVNTLDWAQDITDFFPLIIDTIQNQEEDWLNGAFNSIKNPADPFDYGWGKYVPQETKVIGDKIFVLRKRDGSYVKIRINELFADYKFQIADLNGDNEVNSSVPKVPGTTLIYYSIDNDNTFTIPNEYHLVFQRYYTLAEREGVFLNYAVTGVLSAPGVTVAPAIGVDPATASIVTYKDSLEANPLTRIGHDWKFFDLNTGYMVLDDRVYFIQLPNTKLYKIEFLDFEGVLTGITTFRIKEVNMSSTEQFELPNHKQLIAYPNPATTSFKVGVQLGERNQIALYDNLGRKVMNQQLTSTVVQVPSEINAGLYSVEVIIDGQRQLAMIQINK